MITGITNQKIIGAAIAMIIANIADKAIPSRGKMKNKMKAIMPPTNIIENKTKATMAIGFSIFVSLILISTVSNTFS